MLNEMNNQNNRPSWRDRFKLTKEEIRNKKIFTVIMYTFYIVCFVSILIAVFFWWDNKETFYLTTNEVSMILDDDYQISLYGSTEKKENDEYTYIIDNPNIVSVDKNGLIHSISEGETFITVKSKYSFKYNVIKVHVEGDSIFSVEFENNNIDLDLGEKQKIKPIVNGNKDFKADIIWKSENSRIVSVSSSGEFKGMTTGTTYVKATVRGTNISSRIKVNVTDNLFVSSVKKEDSIVQTGLDNNTLEGYDTETDSYIGVVSVNVSAKKNKLRIGEKLQLSYSISPNNATNKNVVWYSSDETVAVVNNKGVVTPLSPGKVDISVKTKEGNMTSFVQLEVISPNAKNIELNKSNTTLKVWGSEQLVADLNISSNSDLIWKSSNPSIVSVNQKGRIIGFREGNVIITVSTKDGKNKAICNVSVKNLETRVKTLSLNRNNLELSKGSIFELKATITPSNATNQNIAWESSNPKVVTVDDKGVVKGISNGKATITAISSNGIKQKCDINVSSVMVNKITVNKSAIQLSKGSTYNLKVSISPNNAENKSVSYIVSDNNVAHVSKDGVIKAVGLGSTKIKVKANDKSGKVATINVVVVPKVNLINITKQKYKTYYKGIETYVNSTYPKHMQNFAIQNIGTRNEYIYLSGVVNGSIRSKKITAQQKKYLNRTFVVKFKSSEINKNTKNRNIMWLENSGHGQSFDIESNGIIWTNANAMAPYYSGGAWYGKHSATMRLVFKPNKVGSKFGVLKKLNMKDSSGNIYSGVDASVDDKNNLLALRSGRRVFVYNLKEAQNGKLNLLYSFKVADAYGSYRQGNDINGGFYYLLTGKPGGIMNITAYNMLGEKQYSKNFYVKNASQAKKYSEEAEGLKVYNNRIYIGNNYKSGKGYLFNIGYFK